MKTITLVALTALLSFSALAEGKAPSMVSFHNRNLPCVGNFLESKEGEAEPLLTVVGCLENLHSGGLELKSGRGEVFRSQDVSVHPSLLESRVVDPAKVPEELSLAVVFFPSGTRERLGLSSIQVAKSLPTDSTTLVSGSSTIPGTPVLDKTGGVVALQKECESSEEKDCKTVSLFTEISRGTLLSAKNSDRYAMGEVSVPDATHELGLFFRRQQCQQTCQQPVRYYYCQPQPQPQQPQCGTQYQKPAAPPPPPPQQPVYSGANIKGANIQSGVIVNSNIQNSNITNSVIVNSNIQNSNIPNSTLQNTNVHNSNVPNSTLTNANIHDSHLPNSSVTNANIHRSSLPNSSVRSSNTYQSNLPNSSVRNSNVRQSNVSNSTFHSTSVDSSNSGRASTPPPPTRARSVSYSPPAGQRNISIAAVPSQPVEQIPLLPQPPPPPPYNGMYDTAATRPHRVGSSSLENQVAKSVRELDGTSAANANLLAATTVPLLKGETVTAHSSSLTLLAKGETPSERNPTLDIPSKKDGVLLLVQAK